MEPICEYYIFKNGLMEFIIESGVGIICFQCVYCFKTFLGDVSLITLNVSIAQCSFSFL
jgi:hypothetical protein